MNFNTVSNKRIFAIISKQEFETYFYANTNVAKNLIAISITDPDVAPVPTDLLSCFKDSIQLSFHDSKDPDLIISDEDAKVVKEFILKHKDEQFVIHCMAGQSRSPGIGIAIECLLDYNGDRYAYQTGHSDIKNNKRYFPNLAVYEKIVKA